MARIAFYCARYKNKDIRLAPLGIGYIASYIVYKGIVKENEVLIADDFSEVLDFKPDIVAVSSVSQVITDAIEFAKACKKEFNCAIILGGYHITCMPYGLPDIFDVGVLGEGEDTFLEIVNRFIEGRLSKDNLYENQIPGICFKYNDNIIVTERRELMADIDTLPQPIRHRNYSEEIPIITSRGCPYRCIYCASHSFWGDHFRMRSAKSVVEEMLYLIENFRPKEIAIVDDLWMADKVRFKEIVELLLLHDIPKKVSLRGFCRSNIIYENEIELLKKINYSIIRFGAETGSESLLKRIKGDGISITDHQRVIDLCQKHGLHCTASFMFGIPGESIRDLELTVEFLRCNKGKLSINGFYFFNPIPGTFIWESMDLKVSDISKYKINMLDEDFVFDRDLYLNDDNVPFEVFIRIIDEIKSEFL